MARLRKQRFDFNIGQPNLCLIFNSKKMKRIIIITTSAVWGLLFVSCTNDNEEVRVLFVKQKNSIPLTTIDSLSAKLGPEDETAPIK